jgi:hypothetical protein
MCAGPRREVIELSPIFEGGGKMPQQLGAARLADQQVPIAVGQRKCRTRRAQYSFELQIHQEPIKGRPERPKRAG